MFDASVTMLGLTLLLSPQLVFGDRKHVLFKEPLKAYLRTLERYANTANDVVFLLDESGSIGEENFEQVKLFAKLTSQRLSVSADYSRVAVLTFAFEPETHVNYIIEVTYGNNMCSLLVEIDGIGYKKGGTYTDLALLEAERILAQSRPRSNKIIVLLTDGESNGDQSPVGIADRLKRGGIIIFAVGVAKVNVEEIRAVASSLNHTYILDDFNYIDQINKYLVEDTKDIMDPAEDSSYCDGLCDDSRDCCVIRASCNCGTRTGRYECACQAGYHGISGLKGHCYKCPRGTYKSEALNKDCTPCPPHATTGKEGSTSFLDCKCETGYEKIGNFCSPVRCASLSVPDGGILIPTHCNNTFGTRCSLRCSEGYCPLACSELNDAKKDNQFQALTTRTCLENKEWSGPEFHCEKRTCPVLSYPSNGKHSCSENDFTFGTVCSFHCDKGHELFGSESRTCMINTWTGTEVTCKEKFCDPLKTNDLLHVNRTRCSTDPMPYRSVCQYHCSKGYILVHRGNKTDGVLTCGENRKWIGDYEDITCQDIEPPQIICPQSIQVDAEPHKGYADIAWDFPQASDNVPGTVTRIQTIEPKVLQKSPNSKKLRPAYYFPIGLTKIVYEATDRAKLTSTCAFSIEVLDKEPPSCISCPEDIEIFHNTRHAIPVEWNEPIFEDNSKKFSMECSRKSGDKFGWGPAVSVHCMATDESNNTASCNFSVKVKHYPCPFYDPPANGVVTCETWSDGRMCSVFCHEGYQFATAGSKFERTYFCQQIRTVASGGKIVGQWGQFTDSRKIQMPWPDCSKNQKPSAINAAVGLKIGVDSCSEESLKSFREKFFKLDAFKTEFFCPKDKGCAPENVYISCNPAYSKSERTSKRDEVYGNKQDLPMQSLNSQLTINYSVILNPNTTHGDIPIISGNEADGRSRIDLSASPFLKELETQLFNNTNSRPEVEYNATVICSVGQIIVNNTCVNCPAGTYKDDENETCIVCPTATYQDEERRLSCKKCPVGFTTHEVKSKSPYDCKGPCQPGTYSQTTFEPCLSCPLNTYQNRSTRKYCFKCPQGLNTWRVGANASSDCVAPCKQGTYSDTGHDPCDWCEIGTFQDKEKQINCTICPDRTTTKFEGATHFETCTEFDICNELNPCLHNSTCIQRDKQYECLCPNGLRGRNCEINVDDCASSPCLNGGTCFDGLENFTCLCLYGFTGHQCQTNLDDCDPNLCLNGGKCVDGVDAFECECLAGFNGKLCEQNIYECKPNPCYNGGTCFDMQNGFKCCCPEGFYGPKCEEVETMNACDSGLCHNGGTCSRHEGEDSYSCTCPPGFEGEQCETDVDDCQYHECGNGGQCIDGVGNATCACPERYTGLHCEDELLLEYTLSFPTASTTNYVALNNARRLYSITVSFFMRTNFKDPNSRATPISYSYKHKDHLVDNALTLLDTNNFVLYLHGEPLHTHFSGNRDSSWHHYAITWEKLGGKWAFFVDGRQPAVASGQDVGENKYMHPGTFVLGQEQDDIGSTFSMLEAFVGDITEFNVWDYAMTADEISDISSSCGNVGNVIPWFIASQYVNGHVKIHENWDGCETIGHCSPHRCNCVYSNETEATWCKNQVLTCTTNTCANNQPCISDGEMSFCKCDAGFEGRRCEYDIDECLDGNGGCDFICVNDVGTGSYHCECLDDLVLSEDGKTCKDTGYCVKDGQTYMSKDAWVSNCQNCFCNNGIVEYRDVVCNEITCQPNESLVINPGECCSKCVAWSFCTLYPNNTIVSFNTSRYQIESGLNYTALEDCIDGRFKVQVEFTIHKIFLVVHQDCSKCTISSEGNVFIDDDEVVPPFENGLWNVEKTNASVSVKTNSGLIVEWDTRNDAVVAVSSTHQSKMCGLCRKMEQHYVFDTGKFRFPDRWAIIRLLASEKYSLLDKNLTRRPI